MRQFGLLLTLLLLPLVTRAEEDELRSVALERPSYFSCIIRSGCEECKDVKENAQCGATGFTHRLDCFHRNGSAAGQQVVEPCDPNFTLLDMFQFALTCLVAASLALLVVRQRKNVARQHLVTLVNRS